MYELLTFGIPTIPIDAAGEAGLERYHLRLEESKAQELDIAYYHSVDARIYCPPPLDVLRGRGKPFQEHSGNMRLAEPLEKHLDV